MITLERSVVTTEAAHAESPTFGETRDRDLKIVAVSQVLRDIRDCLDADDCAGAPDIAKHGIFAFGRELAEAIGLRQFDGVAVFGDEDTLSLVADFYPANRRLEVECRVEADRRLFKISRVGPSAVNSTPWIAKIYDVPAHAEWLLIGGDGGR